MDASSRIVKVLAAPAGPCASATRLSEGQVERSFAARRVASSSRAGRVIASLARASLVVSSLAMTTGCLITDPPQFKPAKHTRPFLANPDPLPGVIKVDSTLFDTTQSVIRFSADVFSQDDPVDPSTPSDFTAVSAVLYIDYGFTGGPGDDLQPYRFAFNKPRPLDPGTIDQTKRRVTLEWHPNVQRVDPGCHNATLTVSHVFDDVPCPACSDDSASITWQILRCSSSDGTCNDLPVTGTSSCEGLTNSCTAVRKKLEAQDAVLACPEDSTDGGAQ